MSQDCKHLESDNINESVGYWNNEKDPSKTGYHISGCYGGGCYVITGIKFCPFCGIRLKEEPKSSAY